MGHPRSLELALAQFDRARRSLLAFRSNYVPNLHIFWDIARYWSKITNLNLPHRYLACPLEWPQWNFADIFSNSKLDSPGYRAALFAIWYVWLFWQNTDLWRRTDRQTDGTKRHHILR